MIRRLFLPNMRPSWIHACAPWRCRTLRLLFYSIGGRPAWRLSFRLGVHSGALMDTSTDIATGRVLRWPHDGQLRRHVFIGAYCNALTDIAADKSTIYAEWNIWFANSVQL